MSKQLAMVSTSEALNHVVTSRLRNLLFKTAKKTTDFLSKKQHLVLDSGILQGNFGVDLGVVRYACIYKYRIPTTGHGGHLVAKEPTVGDLSFELVCANTGTHAYISGQINLKTGTFINREGLSQDIDGLGTNTTRFDSILAILDACEKLDLLTTPTFVLTEGDESKYYDVVL